MNQHKHEFVARLAEPSLAKKARKTLNTVVKEFITERGDLMRPVLVRKVDPAELAANGGVVPRETISKPTPYRAG